LDEGAIHAQPGSDAKEDGQHVDDPAPVSQPRGHLHSFFFAFPVKEQTQLTFLGFKRGASVEGRLDRV